MASQSLSCGRKAPSVSHPLASARRCPSLLHIMRCCLVKVQFGEVISFPYCVFAAEGDAHRKLGPAVPQVARVESLSVHRFDIIPPLITVCFTVHVRSAVPFLFTTRFVQHAILLRESCAVWIEPEWPQRWLVEQPSQSGPWKWCCCQQKKKLHRVHGSFYRSAFFFL